MLYISRWKALAIVMTTLVICLFGVPNLLSPATVKDWPKWAQRHVVLGLDLQGGSHLLLEVDTKAIRKEKVEQLRDEVRKVLREAKVGLTQAPLIRGESVEVRIRPSDLQQGLTKLRELSQPLGGLLSTTGQRTLEINSPGDGLVRLTWTEPAIIERVRQAVEQSIQIVTRRIDELGTVEPVIQRQGVDRILIQVPGLGDPKDLIELLGKTAKLDFRMVDQSMTPEQALASRPPPEFGDSLRHQGGGWPALPDREARGGVGRRPCRCATDVRPAHPGAGGQHALQCVGLAALGAGHHRERGAAVRDHSRQPGDLGAGDPRADHRRPEPDFR